MTPSRERDARLACRWFGWQWWRDKTNGHCGIVPPEDNRMGWPIAEYVEKNFERCIDVPPPEERYRDWYRCWCDNPLPLFSTDGNAMLSLEAKLYESNWWLNVKRTRDGKYQVEFWHDNNFWRQTYVEADTLPEAVAAAADKIPEGK